MEYISIILIIVGFILSLVGLASATIQANTLNTQRSTSLVNVYNTPELWTWILIIIGCVTLLLGILILIYNYFY